MRVVTLILPKENFDATHEGINLTQEQLEGLREDGYFLTATKEGQEKFDRLLNDVIRRAAKNLVAEVSIPINRGTLQ